MLTKEDNTTISQVGPGTPMGELMRQYWIPGMLAAELPDPDCTPVRVKLLGEELIAFRDTSGRVGLMQNSCMHRGASMFFGRNEENGLRCVYHGWKYDVSGQCVDMPNEPPESNFKNRIRATAYPCVERGGVVWTFMGPRVAPPVEEWDLSGVHERGYAPIPGLPPLPDIEGNIGPNARAVAEQQACNYLQIAEGSIDTSHAAFLHWGGLSAEGQPEGSFAKYLLGDKQPHYAVLDTPAGTMYAAHRPAMPGQTLWRLAQFMLPFYTMNPTGLLGMPKGTAARVPMDDNHTISIDMSQARGDRAVGGRAQPVENNTSDWYGRFVPGWTNEADFGIDRALQKTNKGNGGWTGIVGPQDQAMTTSMGPIYDRSKEHLGTTDAMIIQTRKRLLGAASAFAENRGTPDGVENPAAYAVRSGTLFLQNEEDWVEATEERRMAFVEHGEMDRGGLSGQVN